MHGQGKVIGNPEVNLFPAGLVMKEVASDNGSQGAPENGKAEEPLFGYPPPVLLCLELVQTVGQKGRGIQNSVPQDEKSQHSCILQKRIPG